MKRFLILCTIIFLLPESHLLAKNYYVSNNGNDAADGLTKSTAWKTISKLNTITLSPGDSVFFQATGIWRETLSVKQGSSGTGKRVYYGRYDSGINPKILGSIKAVTWTTTSKANVWQSATTMDDPEDGDWGYPGCIFFENGNSVSWGVSQTYSAGFTNLNQEFDWTWNSNKLYIYAPTDPNTRYSAVEAAQRDLCMAITNSKSSYIEINGIDMHYARRAGYGCSGYPEADNQTDVTFKNCNIGYIGVKGGAYAYGIEAFHSNFLVENCTITDCGRRGISFNFYEDPSERGNITIENVVIKNNVFLRGQHTTSLDLATADYETGDTIRNVYFYNNIVDDHEILLKSDDAIGSNQLYLQPYLAYFNELYVYNNVFIHATWRNILITGGDHYYIYHNTIYDHNHNVKTNIWGNISIVCEATVDVRNNIIYNNLPYSSAIDTWNIISDSKTEVNVIWNKLDYNLYYNPVVGHQGERGFMGGDLGYYDVNHWTNFKTDHPGMEAHSPTPADPQFTDPTNRIFTLKSTSPAVSAGTPIAMVTTDFLGNVRSTSKPSIGAFEYLTSAIPVYLNSQVGNSNPSVVEMSYSLSLANIIPASAAFTVTVNSVNRTVNSVAISGNKVLLTLASPVSSGDNVTVAYTQPASNKIQTSDGQAAASITAQPVTNSVAVPVYQRSSVSDATPGIIELTYNLSLANIIPSTSAFTVMINGTAINVTSVTIAGTKVSLALATPAVYGDIITLSYTKPSTNPIQISSGGQAVSFTDQQVTNNIKQVVSDVTEVEKISLYPNPTDGKLNLSFTGKPYDKPILMKIVNECGETVYETLLEAGIMFKSVTLDLNPGFYLVQFISEGTIRSIEKLLISK